MRSSFRPMIAAALGLALGACGADGVATAPSEEVSASVVARATAVSSVVLRDSTLAPGDTTSVGVVVRDRFGRDVARFFGLKYRSRDTTVATVSVRGVVKTRAAGTSWIVISGANSFVDSVPVVVIQSTLSTDGLLHAPDAAPPVASIPDAGAFSDTVTVSPLQASLPRRFVNHVLPTSTRTILLRQGENLQAAIDSAKRGDQIVLARGAVFNGGFKLRRKAGTGWIVIRSQTDPVDAGYRPEPSQFTSAAKLVTSQNGVAAIDSDPGASGYWISGVEIAAASNVTTLGALVFLSPSRGRVEDVPERIVVDRAYIHGHNQLNVQRCVHFDVSNSAVVDSWISECHYKGLDAQALLVISSPGQLLFRNNHVEGSGENFLVGGAAPSVTGMIPEDIEVVGNHFFKPLSWQGAGWTVKNSVEIKFGRRIDIRDNYIENNWVNGQDGFAVVIKGSNQDIAPWVRTSDVVFRRNIVSGSAAGVNIYAEGPVGANRIAILSNEFRGIGQNSLGGVGRMIQLLSRLSDIEIRHNTFAFARTASTASSAITMDGSGATRVTVVNNIFDGGQYGFFLGGGKMGTAAVEAYSAGAVVKGNAIALQWNPGYGTQNTVVSRFEDFGLVTLASGEFQLVSSSPMKRVGVLGATPGVPAGALRSALGARMR